MGEKKKREDPKEEISGKISFFNCKEQTVFK